MYKIYLIEYLQHNQPLWAPRNGGAQWRSIVCDRHRLATCNSPQKCFPSFFFHGGIPKIIFHTPGTPTYENVYMQEKVDTGESSSGAANLLSRKFIG
jgi:hypothetical protein